MTRLTVDDIRAEEARLRAERIAYNADLAARADVKPTPVMTFEEEAGDRNEEARPQPELNEDAGSHTPPAEHAHLHSPSEIARHQGLVAVADVARQPVTWLWENRIPRGKVTVLDGDPGLGKSTLMFDVAARLSSGQPMPLEQSPTEAADVILLSAEDDTADTIRPRLEAAGADLNRVHVLFTVPREEGDVLPSLPRDVDALGHAVEDTGAALVVIDPLMAWLASDVNAHRDQDVRHALHALAGLAQETKAAVVLIRHLNKTNGGNPLYRGGGSIGIVGAARSGLLVAPHPDDEDVRVLASTKANLGPKPDSLAFRVEPWGDDPTVARIRWIGTSEHDAVALLADVSPEERSALSDAIEFLRELLAEGPVEANEVTKAAQAAGIADRTLRRAKGPARVQSRKTATGWEWAIRGQGGQGSPNGQLGHLGHLGHLEDATRENGPKAAKVAKVAKAANAETIGQLQGETPGRHRICSDCGAKVHPTVGDSHRCPAKEATAP